MIKYLMNQITNQEEHMVNIKENQFKARDVDQEQLTKIENQIRFFQEQAKFTQQEYNSKLKNMEDQIIFTEQSKNELRDKLRVAEDGNREMIAFIKNLQQ